MPKITRALIEGVCIVCSEFRSDIGVYDGDRWIKNILVYDTGRTADQVWEEVKKAIDGLERPNIQLMGNYQ